MHGNAVCQRCVASSQQMAIHVWFQNAQQDLLVTEICNLMLDLAGRIELEYVDVIRSYFDQAIIALEYGCYIYPDHTYCNNIFLSCVEWIYKHRHGEDLL